MSRADNGAMQPNMLKNSSDDDYHRHLNNPWLHPDTQTDPDTVNRNPK